MNLVMSFHCFGFILLIDTEMPIKQRCQCLPGVSRRCEHLTSHVISQYQIPDSQVVCEEFKHGIWKRYRKLDGYEFTTNTLSRTQEAGPIACAVRCSEHDSCQSVTFNSNSHTCIGYSKLYANESEGMSSPCTEYRQRQSPCGDYKDINKTIVTEEGASRLTYKCDYGYVQSGSVTTSVCQQNKLWSDVDIECKDCTKYGSTYSKRSNKFFRPIYTVDGTFVSGISTNQPKNTMSENLNGFIYTCNTFGDYVCKSFIVQKSSNYSYGVVLPVRVYDHVSYQEVYKDDEDYDQYIRNCE